MSVLVSVVIPTYNRAAYLPRALRSALEQRVPRGEVEVIVVDDESTDNTAEVVRAFPSVRYMRQTNRREGAARNAGAGQADGTYLAFLDSDDYWLPDKLAADVARFEQADGPALVYSRALNVDPHDQVIGARRLAAHQGDVFWALARESFVPMSSVAVRADCFRACGGFDEARAVSGSADWELWMRIAARWHVGFVDHTATCIRVHPRGQSMLADAGYMEPAMLAAVEHALADPVVARRAGRRAGFIRACMYVTIALNAYGHQRRAHSLRWLGRALGAWPPSVFDARFLGALARTVAGPRAVRALRTASV